MASKSRDAWRSVATPGWAWAVAGLCGLLLVPLALDNHRLLHTATPLHLAGRPATPPAQLALAGHGAAHTRTPAQLPLVITGGTAQPGRSLTVGAAAGTAASAPGLDLQNPSGSLSSAGTPGAATAAGGPTAALTASPTFTTATSTLLGSASGVAIAVPAHPWNGLQRSGLQTPARRSTPVSAPLIQPRPVTPRPRFWARHIRRSGPASRVRRRRNPRFFGFYVAASSG